MATELHVLNLGGGVQSTQLYLMAMNGEIPPFDYAITADTQDEPGGEERRRGIPDPDESFYSHMDWLGRQAAFLDSQSPLLKSSNHAGLGAPILVRTCGRISEDLLQGNSTGQRFASIPAFTAAREGGEEGQTRRQCTKEYKVEVIARTIRYEILGLKPGDRLPKGTIVHQYIGISWDERARAADIARRFEIQEFDEHLQACLFDEEDTVISVHTGRRQRANWRVHFPLVEDGRRITRDDCERD